MLILKHLRISAADFFEKTSEKSKYLAKIIIFSTTNKAICASQARWIQILVLKKNVFITKTFLFRSNTTTTNSIWSINYIFLVFNKALIDIYNFQIRFCSKNRIFVLLKMTKNIFKMTSILILACKYDFWKKPHLFNLVLNLKASQHPFNHIKNRTINLLGSNLD